MSLIEIAAAYGLKYFGTLFRTVYSYKQNGGLEIEP
jgi:hypothetical protein